MRATMAAHDERIRPATGTIAVRKGDPALDRRTVGTLELQSLDSAQCDRRGELVVHARELAFAGAVDAGAPELGGRLEHAHGVCDARERLVEAESTEASLTGRDLLHGAAVGRHAEEMLRS